MLPFADVNLVAVVVATLINIVIGMTWYSPAVFGKRWMKLVGLTPANAQKGMQRAFIVGISATLISCYFIGLLLAIFQPDTLSQALTLGAVWSIGFIIPTELARVAWEQAKFELFWLNSGWSFLSILVTVAVLHAWPW